MTMISISTINSHPNGRLRIDGAYSTNLTGANRRTNRVKTIDGGIFLADYGYTLGDADLNVDFNLITKEQYLALEQFKQFFPTVRVSTYLGSFVGIISDLTLRGFTLLIKE